MSFTMLSNMNLIQLFTILSDEETTRLYLMEKNLILKKRACPRCGQDMRMFKKKFRCNNKFSVNKQKPRRCEIALSIYTGSWLSQRRFSTFQIMATLYMLIEYYPIKFIVHETKVALQSVKKWYRFIHEVLTDWFFSKAQPVGGEGKVVELYESEYYKTLFQKKELNATRHWAFGGVERGSGNTFFVVMEDTSADTFINIIRQWILPNTTLISKCEKAHDHLDDNNFKDLILAYNISFIASNKVIEEESNIPGSKKIKITHEYLEYEGCLPGFLQHFMFIKSCQGQNKDLFDSLLEVISVAKGIEISTMEIDEDEEPGEETAIKSEVN